MMKPCARCGTPCDATDAPPWLCDCCRADVAIEQQLRRVYRDPPER